jgi:hypothetical protein
MNNILKNKTRNPLTGLFIEKIAKFNLLNICFITFIYTVIYYIQYNSIEVGVILFLLAGILIAIIDRKTGFIYFFLTIFLFDDIPYHHSLTDVFISIDTLEIVGQTSSKIWILIWLILIGSDFLKKKRSVPKDKTRYILLLLLFISLITGLLKGNLVYFGPFVNDFRFFINFLVGYFGVILYIDNSKEIYTIFKVIGLIFAGKLIVLVYQTIFISQDLDIYTIAGDTGLVLAPTILLLYYIFKNQNSKLIIYFLIFLCILSFGISASRGRILVLIIQILLFFFISGRLKYLPFLLLIFPLAFFSIPLISENLFAFLTWKLESFKPSNSSGISSFIRIIEYQNIISKSLNSYSDFFFGQGLGGSWDSKAYPYGFNLIGTTSYPDEWIINDRFFKPHGIIQFCILKFGIGGIILLYYFIFKHFFKLKKSFSLKINDINSINYLNLSAVLHSGVITLFLISYSSKHQLFLGIFLASLSILKKDIALKNN